MSRADEKKAADRQNTDAPRDMGADCVRIAAFVLLLWLHFYLRNGFYFNTVENAGGFIAVMFQPVFLCCVPLFVMLTGYLRCGKGWTARGYRSLIPIICSYLIITLIHLAYKIWWVGDDLSAKEWLQEFLRFHVANYGWYVGMYIGLFLLSPLINTFWAACTTKKQHIGAVLTVAAVTFLPVTANNLGTEVDILPSYFQALYWLAYYMIGCYIRTYRPKPRRAVCVGIVLALGAGVAALNLLTREDAGNFYTGVDVSYNHLISAVITTALFLMFYQTDIRRPRVKKIAVFLAGITFEAYLMSYLFDSNIYVMFYGKYPMTMYFPVGLLMTAVVFAGAMVTGFIVKQLTKKLTGRWMK